MYKILVTNDDGIDALGIKELVKSLSEIATVYVVAPDEQQSAKSRSLTFMRPVTAEEVMMEGAEVAYKLDGTPADCVKWGIFKFAPVVAFDYVISGINMGDNTGVSVYYSGTVAGALEGGMNGFRSLALSVADHEAEHYEYICSMIPELLEMSAKLEKDVVLNVNVPNIPAYQVKGVRIVDLAKHKHRPEFHFYDNEEGKQQMQVFIPEFIPDLSEDYSALTADYATITPIRSGLTSHVALKQLKGMSQNENLCVFIGAQTGILGKIWKSNRFASNITKWARICDRIGLPVLIVGQYGNGKVMETVAEGIKKTEFVETVDFNAIENKDFLALVEASCCKRVYLAGLETHVSIEQTARALMKRGYEVVVVGDCCSAKNKEDHQMALDALRNEACRVESYEAAAMEVMGSSMHAAYSKVKEIIES